MSPEHPIAALVVGEMARMGARTSTICTLLKAPGLRDLTISPSRIPALVRQIYQKSTGESSPPGLMPSSGKWYFSSDRRIMHSSFLLAMAWPWRDLGPEEAYIRAYSVYWHMTEGDPQARAISADRAWFLVQQSLLQTQRWYKERALRKNPPTPPIRLLRCRSCSIPLIASAENIRVVCPVCRDRARSAQHP